MIVLQVGATIFLIYWAVSTIDNALNVSDILLVDPKTGKHIYVPGLGILLVILVVLLAGVVVTNILTQPISNWFNRLPFFNFLYPLSKTLPKPL